MTSGQSCARTKGSTSDRFMVAHCRRRGVQGSVLTSQHLHQRRKLVFMAAASKARRDWKAALAALQNSSGYEGSASALVPDAPRPFVAFWL